MQVIPSHKHAGMESKLATQTPTGQNWHTDANQISTQSTKNRQTDANQIPTQSTGTNASYKHATMESKLVTQTSTEQIRHADAFITFVTQTQITEYKGVSVKCGPDTCGWRMRMGKCGKNKTRNADSCKVRVVNSWHRLLRVFSQFFEPCDSFH